MQGLRRCDVLAGILLSVSAIKAGSQTLIHFAFLPRDGWEIKVLEHIRDAKAALLCPWIFVSASKEGWGAELVVRWR